MMSVLVNINDLVLAGAGLIGMAVSYAAGKRRRAKGPLCSCGHGLSFHENGTGRCRANSGGLKDNVYNATGEVVGYDYPKCNCQLYTGPKLIDSFTGQELHAPPPDETPGR